jgi:DNA mismatch repair ATPase MutS
MWTLAFLAFAILEGIAYLIARPRILEVANHGFELGISLQNLSKYSRLLRTVSWDSSLPQQVRQAILESPAKWSGTATALGLVAQIPIFYFLAIQLVPGLEDRLLKHLRKLPEIWQKVATLDVLATLAARAFEYPADCVPELAIDDTSFESVELRHPMIDMDHAVPNDVTLNSQMQLLMVSGSNMSGKSTLLRTVGVNAVLAMSGATVCARSLRISPLLIGAAMRFQDSLDDGTSYFYNVISRLRRVMDLLHSERPVLYLLDEILQGTNSHDRLVGAEAVIRKLLDSGAIGLVTTHDLELTRVAEHLAPAALNVHFVDTVIDGRLHFDYRMRAGVVQSSNALRLMRDAGLDV